MVQRADPFYNGTKSISENTKLLKDRKINQGRLKATVVWLCPVSLFGQRTPGRNSSHGLTCTLLILVSFTSLQALKAQTPRSVVFVEQRNFNLSLGLRLPQNCCTTVLVHSIELLCGKTYG